MTHCRARARVRVCVRVWVGGWVWTWTCGRMRIGVGGVPGDTTEAVAGRIFDTYA